MSEVKRILAIAPRADGIGDSIGYALDLARDWGAELEVLYHLPDPTQPDLAPERLQALQDDWQRHCGRPVPLHLSQGGTLTEGLERVQNQGRFDLVIKAEHDTTRKLTVDWQVLRQSPATVLLLTDKPHGCDERVLLAMDLGHRSKRVKALNRKLLARGKAFAAVKGAELHVLYVPRLMRFLRDLELTDAATVTRQARERHAGELEWLKQEGIDENHIHIKAGDPSLVMWDVSCKLLAHTLVVGCFGREGIIANFRGHTAERMLSRLRCDLMVVPADP